MQISDVHLGEGSTLSFVEKLVNDINRLHPDLIVSTGDLFDGYLNLLDRHVDCLRQLDARLGKFAVTGNHEVYAGLEACVKLTEEAGFRMLRNEVVTLTDGISIIGLEDAESPLQTNESALLSAVPESTFRLLLKHRPHLEPECKGRFELQLSGHTHGGQIFPFYFLTKLQYSLGPGLNEIGSGQRVYVSRGTGSWGPQMRLAAPPEISVFDLKWEDPG